MTKPAAGLARFHAAHKRNYSRALREINRGVKETHWMWFIFPQHRGLAKSETARHFGIASRGEAVAYLADDLLRAHLYAASVGVLRQRKLMFSDVDTRKLRSCMTLFREVADDPKLPNEVLAKWFDGRPDQLTLDLLAGKTIVLPPSSRPVYHQPGLIDRHWDSLSRTRPAVRIPAPDAPWTRERVQSFVRSFGLSTVATRQMVDAWMADRGKAMGAAYAAADFSRDHREQ